ncbi:MAG: sulfatase-like hydrolase/transferase [Mariniblastus sp.]
MQSVFLRFPILFYATFVGFLLTTPAFAIEKPNIILLFADDQRADTVGAHGNSAIKTPNLDQLASSGYSFRNNYCAGSFSGAVCVASRAMLMTGRHWMRIPTAKKSTDWAELPVLPSWLEEQADYKTFIVGKWHNGKATLQHAFSDGKSVYMGGMVNHAEFKVQDFKDKQLSPARNAGGFSSEVFADEAVNFIESAKSDQPFFLYVAFTAPHDPRNPPEKYREMYYQNRPPLPANFLPQHPFKNAPQSTMGRDEGLAPWPRTRSVVSDQLCEYYGLVTHLDLQVGRILKALKDSPHADNTYVIYTADHGLAMGSHGLLGKQNIYEQSMKCPLIISGPDINAGQTSQSFTYVHDLYATVCDFAGVKQPTGIDSLSLASVISGDSKKIRDSLFLPFQDNQRSVNDGRWKLHIYPQINHRLLFDLESDPHEMINLADSPEQQNRILQLTEIMNSWRADLGDPTPLVVDNPQPKEAIYDNRNRRMDVWQPEWIRKKYFSGRKTPDHGSKK